MRGDLGLFQQVLMIDKGTFMMDAGMRLFESEKPYGIVLGGIKNEMAGFGKVLRTTEFSEEDIPELSKGCDLFMDRSTRYKSKYISCSLEDAGTVGRTADGEEIHRYAALVKEGNKNTNVGVYVHLALIIIWAMLGWFISDANAWVTLAFAAVGVLGAWFQLRPSKDNARVARNLLKALNDAK